MKVSLSSLAAVIAAAGLLAACSAVTEVTTVQLAEVIERDAIAFEADAIPAEVIERFASHKVVFVGETHWLREHRIFMAELIRRLHDRGFRQILVEWPQMVDWTLADYVNDGGIFTDWEPGETFGGSIATAVRDFNRTLPDEEHFQVRAVDINLADYGGASSFHDLLRTFADHLPGEGPLAEFFTRAYGSQAEQRSALEALRDGLEGDQTGLAASWGQDRYEMAAEMVEVELVSVGIRALYGRRYDSAARMREDVIKMLADRRLAGYPYGSLINFGGNHAQKSRFRGTDQEWLGDYLVHKSEAPGGPVIVVGVTAARIEPEPGATARFDLMDASPSNEVFRVMSETWPGMTIFLPLDDPLFTRDGVPMNYEGTVEVGAPALIYDAFLQYPLAHYIPIR